MPGGKGKQTTSISPRAWANAWAPQLGWRQLPQPNTRGHSNNSCGKGSGNRSSSAPQGVGKDNRGRENQSKVGKNSQPEPETYKPTSRGVDYAEPGGPKGQAGKGERRQERRERRQQAKPCGGDNDGGSKSGPDQTDGRTRRGALKKVAELAKSACWVDQARRRLRSRFFSANTRASKNSKRSKVWEIARVVAAGNDVLPLDTDTLEATAATLMESGIKAADQYLGELKGLHIEAGFWWTDKLNHHMAMCKRALSRGRGPEKRAKELKIEGMRPEVCDMRSREENEPTRVGWSYTWAACWMLRAAEAVEVRRSHVTLSSSQKSVRLHIPKSKMDQNEKGTFRTLGCCGKSPCVSHCAWRIASHAVREAQEMGIGPEGPLFPSPGGAKVSQFHLIKAWQNNLDEEVTGHSARRSGACITPEQGYPCPKLVSWDDGKALRSSAMWKKRCRSCRQTGEAPQSKENKRKKRDMEDRS